MPRSISDLGDLSPRIRPPVRRLPRRPACCCAVLAAVATFGSGSASGSAPVGESAGERVVRFFETDQARQGALPSLSLEHALLQRGPVPEGFGVHPEFTTVQGRHSVRIPVEPGTSLYGAGEVAGPLLRNGRAITLWNYDAYGYGETTPHLYQSHPWVLGVRRDGSAFGVLFDTPERAQLDLAHDILFVADGPAFPVVAIERDSPQEILRVLADLTGHMPLPPLWALGYHQCRYSYFPDERVLEVAHEFRRRHIPCDVLWLDIDYMDGSRCFTFDPARFPHPDSLTATLHRQGFRCITILDPGIKVDPGYFAFDSGTRSNVWVRRANGSPYEGKVWPGRCVFPDFTNGAARVWWAGLVRGFVMTGIDGLWNDMNEPALFDVESKTMPLDNLHLADSTLGGPGPHARYHNVYGMEMARASRDGLLAARPDRRPFVLTRASHLGGQRWAATWTGDNSANEYHLDVSIPMVLDLGLSGQPFAGPDIGGFAGNGDPQLFARWMGIGALLPFSRGHTEKGAVDKEPWAQGGAVERTCRAALQRRYRLLPYLYTLFREASETGLPVARPLFFADPRDSTLRAEDDAFLLGDAVLVQCRGLRGRKDAPVQPQGIWRSFDLAVGDSGNADLPDLFARGGSIVPLGPVMEHTGEKPTDPLELLVCPDARGHAEGSLYEDEGDGYGYQSGRFRLTRLTAESRDGSVEVTGAPVDGRFDVPARSVVVRVLLDGREARAEGRAPATGSFALQVRADR